MFKTTQNRFRVLGGPLGGDSKSNNDLSKASTHSDSTEATCPLADSFSSLSFGEFPEEGEVSKSEMNLDGDLDYGYGDAKPDSADKYGYGDAAPDSDKYGYGDATPDVAANKYGYGDAAPDSASPVKRVPDHRRVTARRSSMKNCSSPRKCLNQNGSVKVVSMPITGKKVRRRVSIAFESHAQVKQVTPIAELTDNPEQLWFQEEEYTRMQEKSFKIIDKYESGAIPSSGKKTGGYCIRGLEQIMSSNADVTLQKKYDAWDSVLNEQYLQTNKQTFDETSLANAYKMACLESRMEARKRASQDEEEVQNYLKSTRRACRRLSCAY